MGTEIPLKLLDMLPAQKKKELLEVLAIMRECDQKEEKCIMEK